MGLKEDVSSEDSVRYYATMEIFSERMRQFQLKKEGRFKYTPSEVSLSDSKLMLDEEHGEVARAILGSKGLVQEKLTVADVRKELIQVAAIALAMVEGIDTHNDEFLLGEGNGTH